MPMITPISLGHEPQRAGGMTPPSAMPRAARYSASAPEMISINSLVILAWRWRL